MNQVVVTTVFPLELEHRARMAAAERRMSRSEFVRQATEAYLSQLATVQPKRSAQLIQAAQHDGHN